MSVIALKQAVEEWLFGERFNLRSSLDKHECKRRIREYNAGLTPSVTTDYSAFCMANRVFVNMQLARTIQFRHTPSLMGKMSTAPAGGTEIVGRSGGDLTTLGLSTGMEIVVAWAVITVAPAEPLAWLILLLPIVHFILMRRSHQGEKLIDFLQQLLEAEVVLARRGDPIVRV